MVSHDNNDYFFNDATRTGIRKHLGMNRFIKINAISRKL